MLKTFRKNHFYVFCLLTLVFSLNHWQIFQSNLHLNQPQAIAFGIFLIAAVLWVTEWLPLYLTSFVILFLQICWLLPTIHSAVGSKEQAAYLLPFFNDTTMLFLGGFVLAATLHKYGLDNRIALGLLKKTGEKPSRVLLGIMLISAILSMWMSNTATTAMMFAIILPITANIPESNTFSKALALSIPFSCNLGGLGTPIGTPPNAIAMNYMAEKGLAINFGDWMLAALPFMMVLIVLAWYLLLKMFPPGSLTIKLPDLRGGKMTLPHWLIIVIFLMTIAAWLTTKIHGWSLGTVSLIPIILFFGLGFLNSTDFRALPWDVLFMVGGGICLGVGLKESGLTQVVVELIPVSVDFFWITTSFAAIAAFMTTFMSNTATANLLIPIAISLNNNTSILVITIAMICSTAMALPVSTPPNAIAFASGLFASRDMAKSGLIITIISIIVIIGFGTFYWSFLGF